MMQCAPNAHLLVPGSIKDCFLIMLYKTLVNKDARQGRRFPTAALPMGKGNGGQGCPPSYSRCAGKPASIPANDEPDFLAGSLIAW